jgi:hypothetical protein
MMSAFHHHSSMKRRRSPDTVTSQSSDDDAHHSLKRLRVEDNVSPIPPFLSTEHQNSVEYHHPAPQHAKPQHAYSHHHHVQQQHFHHHHLQQQQKSHSTNGKQYHHEPQSYATPHEPHHPYSVPQQTSGQDTKPEEIQDYTAVNSLLGKLHHQRHGHGKQPQRTLPSNSKLF